MNNELKTLEKTIELLRKENQELKDILHHLRSRLIQQEEMEYEREMEKLEFQQRMEESE